VASAISPPSRRKVEAAARPRIQRKAIVRLGSLMAEPTGNTNGRSRFDWRTSAVTVAAVLVTAFIQWGVMSAQIADHSRRLDLIDRQLTERSVAREEYDRRHEDLIRQVDELRKELQDFREQEARRQSP
jgi:chromosome segregation ATPase